MVSVFVRAGKLTEQKIAGRQAIILFEILLPSGENLGDLSV